MDGRKKSLRRGTKVTWPTVCNRRSARFVTEYTTWRFILKIRKELMSFGCHYDLAKPQSLYHSAPRDIPDDLHCDCCEDLGRRVFSLSCNSLLLMAAILLVERTTHSTKLKLRLYFLPNLQVSLLLL